MKYVNEGMKITFPDVFTLGHYKAVNEAVKPQSGDVSGSADFRVLLAIGKVTGVDITAPDDLPFADYKWLVKATGEYLAGQLNPKK